MGLPASDKQFTSILALICVYKIEKEGHTFKHMHLRGKGTTHFTFDDVLLIRRNAHERYGFYIKHQNRINKDWHWVPIIWSSFITDIIRYAEIKLPI